MDYNKIKQSVDMENDALQQASAQQKQQDKVSIFECDIDYKNVQLLRRFVSERGKIIPSRINNQPLKRQRQIAQAIKRARILALMPFVAD